jgi:hypothetical protein
LPAKHTLSRLGRQLSATFPDQHSVVRRAWMLAGAVLAAAALVGSMVWVRSATGSGPRPLMVQPVPVASAYATPEASPPVPLRSASPTPTVRRAAAPPPTTRKSPPRTSPVPPRPPALTATYMAGANRGRGYFVMVMVRNPGSTPQSWSVSLRYDAAAGVRIGQAWNATVTRRGDTTVLTGASLAPGATVSVGFQATQRGRGRLPTPSCTINGSRCAMR